MHKSVLLNEALEYLNPKPGDKIIDATINAGGHAFAIIEKIKPNGKLLGIEATEELYSDIQKSIRERGLENIAEVVNDNFVNLKEIIERENFRSANGILFDLGLSSWHLEESGKGFTFKKNEPLDMRMGDSDKTAEDVLKRYNKDELKKIFKEYGGERFAGRIAEMIVRVRKEKPLKTTFDLIEAVRKAIPARFRKGRIHFATKIFQALRIEVNSELENLKFALSQAEKVLAKNGKIVVISFHSLEDHIVKNFFREKAKMGELEILTKKPITPTFEEVKNNPRARSAKLRAARLDLVN